MKLHPQISVIIPAYNAGKFICSTLKTISEQTMFPFEVIVVDDGSSDNTCQVVEEFSIHNPNLNIRLLREPHLGPGAARNAGVQASERIWLAFLDSDDYWLPTKLERMASEIHQSSEANFICHNVIRRKLNKSEEIIDFSKGYDSSRSLIEQLYTRNLFSPSAIICRRDMVIASGGFDKIFPSGQDYDLWLRLSPNLKVIFVKDVLGIYNDRVGNITSSNSWHRFKNYQRILYRHRNKVSKILRCKVVFRSFLAFTYRLIR